MLEKINNFVSIIAGVFSIIAFFLTLTMGWSFVDFETFINVKLQIDIPLTIVFEHRVVRLIFFVLVEYVSKSAFGFFMAYIVCMNYNFRFARIFGMALLAFFSAGMTIFDVQSLLTGKPGSNPYATWWIVATMAIFGIVSLFLVYDHQRRYFGYRRTEGASPRYMNTRQKLMRWLRAHWDLALIGFYISIAFVVTTLLVLNPQWLP
ncbi:MAG: hypothetical protein KDK39_05735 [Leptospiraceae bacterium]|nr:hypothetical protein [Leptospiraceae bacterium]